MKNTIGYLDDAKKALNIESDNAMAKHLGITRSAISNYRAGSYVMDDYAAAKIAEALMIEPMEVIAAANMEREKTEDRKAYWENFYKRLGGVAASIMTIAILSALPDQSQANEGISFKNNKILYIM